MKLMKCCVGGCSATNETHRLFIFPKNDYLRKLWLDFLVPTNSVLGGLTKQQLMKKRVCERHFDEHQFDGEGKRIRFSYPCLITESEIAEGVPLASASETKNRPFPSDHNYFKIYEKEKELESSKKTECNDLAVNSEPQETDAITEPLLTERDDVSETSVTVSDDAVTEESMHSYTETIEPQSPEFIEIDFIEDEMPSRPHTPEVVEENQKSPSPKPLPKKKILRNVKKKATEEFDGSASEGLEDEALPGPKELFDNFHLLNKETQTFLLMQLRLAKRKKMGRRFTLDEKLMAIMIMKQSPKGYKLLKEIFALPNIRTLHRISQKITMKPGLNPKMFVQLADKTKYWDVKRKLCTIVFDEVTVKNSANNLTDENKTKYLVFMLRGICSSWQQSIAYYSYEGTEDMLQDIIEHLVLQVVETGLIPLGIVCNQRSAYWTFMRHLRDEIIQLRYDQDVDDDGSVNIAGLDLSIFFDPPHLLKGIRNHFLNRNIIWNGKAAMWSDILFVYELDSKLGQMRTLPKLTASHVEPDKINKVKVSLAAQVFSAGTAAVLKYTSALNYFHHENPLSTMSTTADVVKFFDNLFDSVNGYPGGVKKGKLRGAVTKDSQHHEFWIGAIDKLRELHFVDSDSALALLQGKPRSVRVPSLDAWIITLESFLRLSRILFEKYDVDFYFPRNINQDTIGNFFGHVRNPNCKNVDPEMSEVRSDVQMNDMNEVLVSDVSDPLMF